MAVDAEMGAIIGGCVAGAVVLIAIIAVIVYLVCGKRRKKRERDQKKFHQLTPHISPAHSQPSTLGHGPNQDPRLPKVSSNGLWMGAPGIYAATPSPAYYYGRPGPKPYQVVQPAVMQRASSETRLPQRDRSVSGSHSLYAAGGSQQRIYHSQQLASLTPLYEVMDPRDGSIYDVYQIGGSKTKLLQDHGKSSDRQSKGGKRAQRSNSDMVSDPVKKSHRPKPPQENHRSSKTSSVTRETVQVHETRPKPPEAKVNGVANPAFSDSVETTAKDEKAEVVASATDSMKLLAKNKTDDQKTVVGGPEDSDTESKHSESTPAPTPIPVPPPDPSLHYTYGGDIYAVPDKEEGRRRSKADNPILARMQDMVIERSEGVAPGQIADPVTDLTETAEPLLMLSSEESPVGGASLIQNPIYQDVEEVSHETEAVRGTEAVATNNLDTAEQVMAAARSAVDELDGGAGSVSDGGVASRDFQVDDVAAASAVTSLRDAGASDFTEEQQEATVVKGTLETRWSTDTDAAADELSRAGKHISVTAEAFEFLDTYLSDEDGVDIHSPPKSPVLSDREEMLY